MDTLEERISQIESLEAIRNLKHAVYCRCIDLIVAGDLSKKEKILRHLADNVVADFTGFELMEGKKNVAAFLFETIPSILSYSQHRVTNDIIEIDGGRAKASWYVDCPVVFYPNNKLNINGSAFIAGRYEEEYIFEDGEWKWVRIVALLDTVQQFDKNWNDARQMIKNR